MNDRPDVRPDPDALLKRVVAEQQRAQRAKLRVYFGYAPGVGKTFKMLEVARELRATGHDVVVGLVETHGRYDTAAQLLGLEVLSRRQVEHRGRILEEFDLDAALARHPQLLILDELPHSNVPGSRHPKRWQDVEELLAAGIEVHTTLNVQHVESLNDVVAQITSIHVRETVPDAFLDRADEIELVDLPPGELLTRLHQGKVYFPEQAERASQNFFQRGNLLALRELALRRAADRVDVDVQAHREQYEIAQTWATTERVLVCVGPSPASARLVRAARRMAAGLRAPWEAAYVETTTGPPLAESDRDRLDEHLRLAESLGATVVRLSGRRVSDALLLHAREHNITRIVIGKPTHSRLRDLLRGSLLSEVVRGSAEIDIHVTAGDLDVAPAPKAQAQRDTPRGEYAWTALAVSLATAIASLAGGLFDLPDVAMLYLATIMLVAARFARGPAITAAGLSVAAFDFFFVPPFYTFGVADTRYLLTFGMMFTVGILISGMTLRLRRQERSAHERELRTAALHALSRELSTAANQSQIANALAQQVAHVVDGGACVLLLPVSDGEPQEAARVNLPALSVADRGVVRWVADHRQSAGLGTNTLPGARVLCMPLTATDRVLGVLAVAPLSARRLRLEENDLLQAFVQQASSALERARLSDETEAAALRVRTEEMRSSLLSAVSHDLRTPLAAITGAATTLRDDTAGALSPNQRSDLLQTACDEAERLERLLANLLEMTRLDSGAVQPRREWVPLEELVGSALNRLEGKLEGRKVETSIPEDLPLLHLDPVLFEQVLLNLIENATKYSPEGSPISLRATVDQRLVIIEVADRGPGIPPGAEQRLFEKFYRGAGASIRGVGLGLAICKAIVDIHDGTIRAENRPGGGSLFHISLPLPVEVPASANSPQPAHQSAKVGPA